MDSKKTEVKESKPEGDKKKKEQPEAPKRGRVIKNKTFTRRVDREKEANNG